MSVLYLVALTPVDIWAACEPCCVEDVRGVHLQPMLDIIRAHASLQLFIMHGRSPSPDNTISDHTPRQGRQQGFLMTTRY